MIFLWLGDQRGGDLELRVTPHDQGLGQLIEAAERALACGTPMRKVGQKDVIERCSYSPVHLICTVISAT